MDTTCHNDPWSSLYALLICPILHRTVNSYISASRRCCSASNATRFFNSIDADTIAHDRMLLESIAIISLWTTVNIQNYDPLSSYYHHYYHCDDGVIAKVHYRTFNVWENHGSNERILWQCYIWWHTWANIVTLEYYDNVIESHETSSSLLPPSLFGNGIPRSNYSLFHQKPVLPVGANNWRCTWHRVGIWNGTYIHSLFPFRIALAHYNSYRPSRETYRWSQHTIITYISVPISQPPTSTNLCNQLDSLVILTVSDRCDHPCYQNFARCDHPCYQNITLCMLWISHAPCHNHPHFHHCHCNRRTGYGDKAKE